jgi:hypothetical protein
LEAFERARRVVDTEVGGPIARSTKLNESFSSTPAAYVAIANLYIKFLRAFSIVDVHERNIPNRDKRSFSLSVKHWSPMFAQLPSELNMLLRNVLDRPADRRMRSVRGRKVKFPNSKSIESVKHLEVPVIVITG